MTFRIPKIKSCCCFSLETGSKIIGCFHMLVFGGVVALPFLYAPFGQAIYVLRDVMYESFLLNFGIVDFFMVYGAFKRDHQLVFPWVLLQSIMMLFFLFSLLGNIAYLGLMDYRNSTMDFECFMILYFFFTMLVVYNFYRDLKEGTPSELG